MSAYPDIITPEILEKQAHIPDQTICADISDTRAEIAELTGKVYGMIDVIKFSTDLQEKKMYEFRVSGWNESIRKRHEFVAFLEKLLAARKVSKPSD